MLWIMPVYIQSVFHLEDFPRRGHGVGVRVRVRCQTIVDDARYRFSRRGATDF